MIIGTPGLDYVSLGLVDVDKLPKYDLTVEDGRRLAKEYSRILMRKHRARKAIESNLLRMEKRFMDVLFLDVLSCSYASHLQQLIKEQHEELLEEGVEMVEEENEGEKEVEEEDKGMKEKVDGSKGVKMGKADEIQIQEMEEHHINMGL
ncbi:hypothetical protein VNO78_10339 [Psophocarpus tetragonolobus]|uniref:Uncharacterized protein n=1 Tax=Psophocarpus tetragonolobus TaxID=3891 RepID=A0AAN9SR99_PSOTE